MRLSRLNLLIENIISMHGLTYKNGDDSSKGLTLLEFRDMLFKFGKVRAHVQVWEGPYSLQTS